MENGDSSFFLYHTGSDCVAITHYILVTVTYQMTGLLSLEGRSVANYRLRCEGQHSKNDILTRTVIFSTIILTKFIIVSVSVALND